MPARDAAGLKPPQPHHPWWSQVVPAPEDSLRQHAGAVPPRSKARRGLPQVRTPRGRALPGRPRGGPLSSTLQTPPASPVTPTPGATDPEQRLCADPSAPITWEGAGQPRSAVFHNGVKKKSSSRHRRRCPSHEKEPAPQRGPWHPPYRHTAAWGKHLPPAAAVPPGRACASRETRWGAERVCKKSRASGHFSHPQARPLPRPALHPDEPQAPFPPQQQQPQPLPWLWLR